MHNSSPSLNWRPPAKRNTPDSPKPPNCDVVTCTKQLSITKFIHVADAKPAIPQGRKVVISLFDNDGTALEPWLKRGYTCIAYQHSDKPREWKDHGLKNGVHRITGYLTPTQIEHDIGVAYANNPPAFACAMPPSKDLSVAGARHWKRKRDKDPEFQTRAVEVIKTIESVFIQWGCPFYISNPATSQLGKLWRSPNHTYQPYEFGQYLAPSDSHPLYPEYIPAQDAYTQHQGLWTGGRFRMPTPRPVAPEWKYFVSKRKSASNAPTGMRRMSPILYSNWNARGARACTPRGFARALCERLHSN